MKIRTRCWQWMAVMGLCAAACAPAAEDPGKQWLHVSKTDRVEFEPGGTIHFDGSHGDLNVEGWDRPEVEVTVSKWTVNLYNAKDVDSARKRLDLITVTLDRKSATELNVTTAFPARTLTRWRRGKSDVMLEYQVHVPRNSRLVVHDDVGAVLVTGVTGDVDAHVGTGDIVVVLPRSAGYSIDAKSDFGNVESDFGGAGRRKGLVGRQLAFAPSTAQHRLFLRVGVGGISVEAEEDKATP